jgi:hypothetical protein
MFCYLPGGRFLPVTIGRETSLPCIMNLMEGFMTVDPSILVSEPAAVIMGDTAVASETAIIQAGIITVIHLIALIRKND